MKGDNTLKKTLAIILAVALALVLVACSGGGGKNAVTGIWVPEGTVDAEYNYGFIFNKDGTFDCVILQDGKPTTTGIFTEYNELGMPLKWKIEGDKIKITVKIVVNIDVAEYTYAMDGNVLVIDGERFVKYN